MLIEHVHNRFCERSEECEDPVPVLIGEAAFISKESNMDLMFRPRLVV